MNGIFGYFFCDDDSYEFCLEVLDVFTIQGKLVVWFVDEKPMSEV